MPKIRDTLAELHDANVRRARELMSFGRPVSDWLDGLARLADVFGGDSPEISKAIADTPAYRREVILASKWVHHRSALAQRLRDGK